MKAGKGRKQSAEFDPLPHRPGKVIEEAWGFFGERKSERCAIESGKQHELKG